MSTSAILLDCAKFRQLNEENDHDDTTQGFSRMNASTLGIAY